MASSNVSNLVFIFACVFLLNILANAQTCTDCFIQSQATYYSNTNGAGTTRGACGFGSAGAKLNYGDVAAAASNLYRDGIGCGACYQVRCTDRDHCSDEGVDVIITDHGESDNTAFILNKDAFSKMAQTADAATYLEGYGVADIEYRRVSCSYTNNNIIIKIDESSGNPYYLAFVIHNQQGRKDITAVQLCETKNFKCQLLNRNHGAVWGIASPPTGPLSLRMLLSDGDDGSNDKWLVPKMSIPKDWKPGHTYDSGIQVN